MNDLFGNEPLAQEVASAIIPGSSCDKCGAPLVAKPPDQPSQHHAKYICVGCGAFNGWQPKPENEKVRRPASHRDLAIKFGNGFCELCEVREADLMNGETLTGHHVEEYAKGGPPTKENVRVYCNSCHEIAHWLRRLRKRMTRGGGQ